jgi:hypothetical protein
MASDDFTGAIISTAFCGAFLLYLLFLYSRGNNNYPFNVHTLCIPLIRNGIIHMGIIDLITPNGKNIERLYPILPVDLIWKKVRFLSQEYNMLVHTTISVHRNQEEWVRVIRWQIASWDLYNMQDNEFWMGYPWETVMGYQFPAPNRIIWLMLINVFHLNWIEGYDGHTRSISPNLFNINILHLNIRLQSAQNVATLID